MPISTPQFCQNYFQRAILILLTIFILQCFFPTSLVVAKLAKSFGKPHIAQGIGNDININLPGRCAQVSNTSGTSYYRMVESFAHTNATFQVNLSDALQPRGSECEKSWSIDNVVVTAYKYK